MSLSATRAVSRFTIGIAGLPPRAVPLARPSRSKSSALTLGGDGFRRLAGDHAQRGLGAGEGSLEVEHALEAGVVVEEAAGTRGVEEVCQEPAAAHARSLTRARARPGKMATSTRRTRSVTRKGNTPR